MALLQTSAAWNEVSASINPQFQDSTIEVGFGVREMFAFPLQSWFS